MNLLELFDSLSFPADGNDKEFVAIRIPRYANFRIAINIEESPVLLLPSEPSINNNLLKNYRLKYIQLEHGKYCRITEANRVSRECITVITFMSSDRSLREYFLYISEMLIKTLSQITTQEEIARTLARFAEIFSALTDVPKKTVQGLWAELFLIAHSNKPEVLVESWHNVPEETFDFSSGEEKIEVKSSSTFERLHTFSAEQLIPRDGVRTLIASVFVKENPVGKSIKQLITDISQRMPDSTRSIEKLNSITCKTLGNAFERSLDIPFDFQIATDSLRFYNQEDISRIEEIHIPSNVSSVKYRSDLSSIVSVNPQLLKSGKLLFKSL